MPHFAKKKQVAMDHFEAQPEDGKKESGLNSLNRCSTMPITKPSSASSHSPLAIFYGGKFRVYDTIPSEKVQGIMLVAAVADTAAKMSQLMVSPSVATAAALGPVRTRSLSFQSSAAGEWQSTPNALSKLQAELPIARRHSLQCFLEKRRNRLLNKIPYASARTSGRQRLAVGE